MTRHFTFACDGAAVPRRSAVGDQPEVRRINSRDPDADLTLRAEPVGDTLLGEVPAPVADLVHIAALAYAADQEVSRGGPADVYGQSWRRRLTLVVPVAEPDFWAQDAVRSALLDALCFLTDDDWEFEFQSIRGGGPMQTKIGIVGQNRPSEVVVLLSGGADSLCAALEAATVKGWRPLLVSHRSATYLDSRQRAVARGLAHHLGVAMLPHASFLIHRRGTDASDTSQRSRGFLFASLGVAAASERGSPEVHLADNGVVSLNLPITRQLLGALASRATHPKFIWRFNRLIQLITLGGPRVVNPLWNRTRAETLDILKRVAAEFLLRETRSCSHLRGRTAAQPQCGGCYQCVDRRFAVSAAELEDYDPASRYDLDVFTHTLPEGDARVTGLSYVQFAQHLARFGVEDLFGEYSELPECILPDDPRSGETAAELGEMLLRHARDTGSVLDTMIKRHSHRLASRFSPESLPDQCLLRLAIGAAGRTEPESAATPNQFSEEGGIRQIVFGDTRVAMRDSQGLRYLAHLLGSPGHEFPVRALVAREHDPDDHPTLLTGWEEDGLSTGQGSDQEFADDQALKEVTRRMAELQGASAEAADEGDDDRLQQIDEEIEELERYVTQARGLHGRPRRFTSDDQRIRNAVTTNISRALTAIRKRHSDLADHLKETLALGSTCSYRPVPPVDWKV